MCRSLGRPEVTDLALSFPMSFLSMCTSICRLPIPRNVLGLFQPPCRHWVWLGSHLPQLRSQPWLLPQARAQPSAVLVMAWEDDVSREVHRQSDTVCTLDRVFNRALKEASLLHCQWSCWLSTAALRGLGKADGSGPPETTADPTLLSRI